MNDFENRFPDELEKRLKARKLPGPSDNFRAKILKSAEAAKSQKQAPRPADKHFQISVFRLALRVAAVLIAAAAIYLTVTVSPTKNELTAKKTYPTAISTDVLSPVKNLPFTMENLADSMMEKIPGPDTLVEGISADQSARVVLDGFIESTRENLVSMKDAGRLIWNVSVPRIVRIPDKQNSTNPSKEKKNVWIKDPKDTDKPGGGAMLDSVRVHGA